MSVTHAFEFLSESDSGPIEFDVAAVYGPDQTMATWCIQRLCGDGDFTQFDGDTARWSDVRDELSTASLFDLGEKRSVVMRSADKFVSSHRPELEGYLAKPGGAVRLILHLESLASNTKVYKSLDKSHLLIASTSAVEKKFGVTAASRRKFLTQHLATRHKTKLTSGAADALVEMLGEDIGFLDTEIAKLALYRQPDESIDEDLVREVVSGWQGKTIWQITEAISNGNASDALRHLDKLMSGGQPPIALLPQIAWSLRRLGLATAIYEHGERQGSRGRLEDALGKAGLRPYEINRSVEELKRIGRGRGRELLANLLDGDLRLKGTHSAEGRDRFWLEQFVVSLANR